MKLFLLIFLLLGSLVLGLFNAIPVLIHFADFSEYPDGDYQSWWNESPKGNFYTLVFCAVVFATCFLVIVIKMLSGIGKGLASVSKDYKDYN